MTVQESASAGGAVARPADGVSVTIDGFEITVPKGTLVIRAAEQLGCEGAHQRGGTYRHSP